MKYDIILSGVGGQGVLSLAAIIAMGAMKEGLNVRQSEVHGMAQRGGAVLSHLRLSDRVISGDLIADGSAAMILSMEPLESLRYLRYLSSDGILVTSKDPVKNIPDYPELEKVYTDIRQLSRYILIETVKRAREAGSPKGTNMVMVGAAAAELPIKAETLESAIEELFSPKGQDIAAGNIEAFRAGMEAASGGGAD
jgi:indolepyruvate ferredoxin oxidoreductase beta subunit